MFQYFKLQDDEQWRILSYKMTKMFLKLDLPDNYFNIRIA